MLNFVLSFIICIFGALTSKAMENPNSHQAHKAMDSGESENKYLLELLHTLQQADTVSEELFTEAHSFVTQYIEHLDILPKEIFEIYCGLLVELPKCSHEKSFEDICIKIVSIENKNYANLINYLVDEFPIEKSTKIKQVCFNIADIIFKNGYKPSENFIIFLTQEIFHTQEELYFEELTCFYIKLVTKNYIPSHDALKFAENCQEDFKCSFLIDMQEKLVSMKTSSRRTPDNNIEGNKSLKALEKPKKDNCIIS